MNDAKARALLLPCPFCGASDAFAERDDLTSAYVMCNSCSAHGPVACQNSDDEEVPGQAAAESAWNTRSPSKPPASFRRIYDEMQRGKVSADDSAKGV